MIDLLKKPGSLNRFEFWAATTIFVFAVFFQLSAALSGHAAPGEKFSFEDAGVPFNYYQHYFWPTLFRYAILYIAFLVLNFVAVPRILARRGLPLQILLVLLVAVLTGVGFGITDTYFKAYLFPRFSSLDRAHAYMFQRSFLYTCWLLLIFAFYTILKLSGSYLLTNTESLRQKYGFVTSGGLTAFVLWIISIFFMLVGEADREAVAIWAILPPSAIFMFWYGIYSLIPASLKKRKPFRAYLGRAFLVLVITVFPVCALATLLAGEGEPGMMIGVFNAFFQLLITVPATWTYYRRMTKGSEELHSLRERLGQSDAHFDFLRSQINPHFLFNALNTIYGTAIQEKAERTGEGIQRLGDMMRFMLQENMQDQIALSREIDYLNNYISLQKLRTDPNPGISIKAEIEEGVYPVRIAPMLLIPFVENAFKHGISLREPSYIKVTLELRDHTLFFDVHNSRHQRPEHDPEQHRSGIGLDNVRQRLQLLYPGRHELITRETGRDYFVHLTIVLS